MLQLAHQERDDASAAYTPLLWIVHSTGVWRAVLARGRQLPALHFPSYVS
jgi:hypothetical protein